MPELDYARGRDGSTAEPRAMTPEQEQRVDALLDGPVVSLHEHPVRLPEPLTAESWAVHMAGARDVLAVEELEASRLDLVVATCFSQPDPRFVERWAATMAEQIVSADGLRPLLGADDLAPAAAIAVGLGLEDLGTVHDLAGVEDLRRRGIVMAGVAYNHGSLLGGGLAQDEDTGLTPFGREAIAIMNRIGMLVDVSHAGDRTAIEAAEASARPIVINHAGARALWGSRRMVPDVVIRAVAEGGGLIGVEAAPGSTRTRPTAPDHDIDDVVRHVEHCAESFGVGAVAIGGDTFYGDHVGLYRALGSRGSEPPAGAEPFDLEPVAGADNPSELPVALARGLVVRGWSDTDVAAVLGGNALRVLRAGLEVTP